MGVNLGVPSIPDGVYTSMKVTVFRGTKGRKRVLLSRPGIEGGVEIYHALGFELDLTDGYWVGEVERNTVAKLLGWTQKQMAAAVRKAQQKKCDERWAREVEDMKRTADRLGYDVIPKLVVKKKRSSSARAKENAK